MKIKYNDAWLDAKNINAKVDGLWKPAKAVWCKYGGVWYKVFEGMPDNLIVLYDTATSVPADATIISALSGRFAYGGISYGSVGGASTHAGSSHGASSATTTSASYGGDLNGDSDGRDHYANRLRSHTHTYSHSHSDTASNLPLYVDVVPTIGGATINTGSIWLTVNSSMSAIFTAYTVALTRYLRFGTTYSLGGYSTHGHSYTGNSSALTAGDSANTENQVGGGAYLNYGTHVHTINHTHTLTNNPSYINLNIYKTIEAISLGDLPSGTIAFFTSNIMPTGWTRYTIADGRLIKCSNTSIASTGGTSTHSHASGAFNTGSVSTSFYDGPEGYCGVKYHTHTMNHGHLTAVSWMPPYTSVVIGIKN